MERSLRGGLGSNAVANVYLPAERICQEILHDLPLQFGF